MQIIEDSNMLEDGIPYEVPRTWKERLFSLPWTPRKKTRTVIPKIPSKSVVVFNGSLVMHPETAKIYRAELESKKLLKPTHCNIHNTFIY
jgi:hypothetical protein